MPHAKILPYHALKTLTQLHAELAGKLSANQRETKRLRLAIFQVEAVMKMLSPEFNIRLIAPKRRNVGNRPSSRHYGRATGRWWLATDRAGNGG